MQIHSDAVTSTGAGGTSDTNDNVGTVRTRDDAVHLLGAWVVAGNVTTTAAEAYQGRWTFANNALSLSTVKTGPPCEGGAPATNIGHRATEPMWIPFNRGSESNPIGQVDITIDFSSELPDVAAAFACAASLVYTAKGQVEQPIPDFIMDGFSHGPPLVTNRMADWDNDSAVATTIAETAIADLVVDKRATGIAALGTSWAPDAFATEEAVGFIRFRSSLSSFEPQEWLLPASGAPLGTAVGTGWYFSRGALDYACWFPKKGESLTTVTPNVVWVAAVTSSSPTVSANVGWVI